MDARKHFLVALLGLVTYLAAVHAVCDSSQLLLDPDPTNNTVTVSPGGILTTIKLLENVAKIRIAQLNCNAQSDVPSIGTFDIGSQMELGLDKETDGSKWYLIVNNSQNYENANQRTYRFSVRAGTQSQQVLLNIVNVDDENPIFLLPDTTPCEINETLVGRSPCSLAVRDPDALMDGMQFRVLNGENMELKVVTDKILCDATYATECVTVGLYTTAELEYIKQPVYSLLLEAEDQAHHIVNLSYVVQVRAENKEAPHFTPKQLQIYIDEEKPGLIETNATTKITVSDIDALDYGQFSLSVEGDGTNDCHEAFNVIPSAGYREAEVKLSVIDPTKLNFDDGYCQDIKLKIKATEMVDGGRTGEAEVNVMLTDLNDETPEFGEEEYVFSVTELEPVNTTIGFVKAIDLDVFDSVTYSLKSTTYMNVDPDTGELTVNAEFNYGRQQQVFATVRADDKAQPPHSTYAQIVVNVKDINNMRPVLTMPWSPVVFKEDISVGTELNAIITAFDEDTDPDLFFSIAWENSRAMRQGFPVNNSIFEDCLTIETSNDSGIPNEAKAVLKVKNEMDREAFDTLYVNITVEDKNTLPEYQQNDKASGMLTVTIEDINDCAPKFSEVGNLTFKENTVKDQLFGIIFAKDDDGPGFNEVSYYLENFLYEKEYITIHNDSGELRTGDEPVDYEEFDVLIYTVVATDGTWPTRKNITIEIGDVNDNKPYFVGDYSEPIEIEEHNPNRTHLQKFIAQDDDKSPEFSTLRYFVEEQYTGIFEIDKVTGDMSLREGGGITLDYEKQQSFTVEVAARDRCVDGCYFDSYSNTTKITIKLKDINDNKPVILNGGKLCTLEEDAQITGLPLGIVMASDADGEENGDLTFEFVGFDPPKGQELFAITKSSRVNASITLKGSLMNEWRDYTLTVKASDPDFSDIANFTITVLDINNNEPVFVFPNKTTVLRFNIFENVLGEVLVDVSGKSMDIVAIDDKDDGVNGTAGMDYIVVGDDTAKTYMEMTRSQLVLIKDFDEQMSTNYKLQLRACDGRTDSDRMCTELETDVRMRFNQQHEPTFNENVWQTDFTENITGMSEVRKITVPVTDMNNFDDCEDEEDDCLVDPIYYFFYVVSGQPTENFDLNKDTAELTLKNELDREEKDTYTLTVVISNFPDGPHGTPKPESLLTVTINVNDVYDTAPVFNRSRFAGGINSGDKTNHNVTTFVATSFDLNDVLTFTIIEESMNVTDGSIKHLVDKKPFKINNYTLVLNFDFQDSSWKGTFQFMIQMTNKGGFTVKAECWVYIISENNLVGMTFRNDPEFVESKKSEVVNVLSNILKYQSNIKSITRAKDPDGGLLDDRSEVTSYYVDDEKNQPISSEDIKKQLNNKETYDSLRRALLDLDIDLMAVSEETTQSTDGDGNLQTILIAVSAVLGALVLVLFAAFFIRTRSLNRRLEAMSTTKFGSQDSGLNRIGMAVPNTNQHAVEGSNPIWNNEEIVQRNYDNVSVSSGDSDLIGVEENPEFSPFDKSGIANDGFTPESAEGRRMSVNPMFAAGLSQLSASALLEKPTVKSANPLAEMQYKDGNDSDSDSREYSEIAEGPNSNFTFYGKMDSIPTTQL